MYRESPISHAKWGDGIRVVGRMVLSDCIISNSTPGIGMFLSASDGGYTACGEQYVFLEPTWLGLRLAANAPFYEMYAFRHARLVYVPIVAATQGGALTLAYVEDSKEVLNANVPGEILSTEVLAIQPSIMSPFREVSALEMNYGGDALFFVEIGSINAEGYRQFIQGAFVNAAVLSDPADVGKTMGTFILEYVCDFHHQTVDLQTEAMADWLPTRSERALVAKTLADYRAVHPKVTPLTIASQLASAATAATSPDSESVAQPPSGPHSPSPQRSTMQQRTAASSLGVPSPSQSPNSPFGVGPIFRSANRLGTGGHKV